MHTVSLLPALLATLLAFAGSAQAAVVWDEAVDGDLSNSGLAPSFVALSAGSNQVLGVTGRDVPGGTVDREYFSITVPVGHVLSAMLLLPGSGIIGGASFIGLQAGPLFTVPSNTPDATGMLGWWLYDVGTVGSDLLPLMAVPSNGSSGFSVPLGAGNYSFWVQETGVGAAPYSFDLQVTAVPELPSLALLLAGLAALPLVRRR